MRPPFRRLAAVVAVAATALGLSPTLHPAPARAATTGTVIVILSWSPSSLTVGDAVTIHAAVSPTAGATTPPTGTVTFMDGASPIGTVTVQNSAADLSTSTLAAGTHHVSASYSGDTTYAGAVSGAGDMTIAGIPVSVTLSSRTNPCVPGQQIVLDASVDTPPGMPYATGTVTFEDRGSPLLTVPLDSLASASLDVVLDTSGTYDHHLTAVYSGDATFASGTSADLMEDVFPMSPTGRYVHQLYNDILGRMEDSGFLESEIDWGHITRGQAAGALAYSKEHVTDVVNAAYRKYLGRDADPDGLSYWNTRILSGLTGTIYPNKPPLATDELLELSFLTSNEYVSGAAGSGGLVLNLYHDILGRDPDAGGLDFWTHRLATGTPAAQLASMLLFSDESMRNRVTDVYLQILWRVPDARGLDYWTSRLQQGARDEDLVTMLAGSDEYWQRTQAL